MPAHQVWEATLGDLQVQVAKPIYDTWLADTKAISLDDSVLSVEVPTPFAVEWLERRMYQLVIKTLRRVTGDSLDVRFQVAGSLPTYHVPRPSSGEREGAQFHSDGPRLNPHFTFSNFVVGPSNQLASSAAQAVADAPGRAYNPLFIYSPVGLGKTHLLQAIGHSCAQQGARVSCLTSEQFTNDFINGILTRTTGEFRARYRGADVLLLDDIQFIGGKEQTQEGFFHTFNDLYSSNKQIVLTSDRPPRALSLLEDRLRSRFEAGLIADIEAPSLETRIAILQSKAASRNTQIENVVLHHIAKRISHSIRALEGALNKVIALARLHEMPITFALASTALDEISPKGTSSPISPEQVLNTVGTRFYIIPEDIYGRKRTKRLVLARHIAMHILHEDLGMGVSEIGRTIGNRDHTTVMYALRKIHQLVDSDPEVLQEITSIRETLGIYSQVDNQQTLTA